MTEADNPYLPPKSGETPPKAATRPWGSYYVVSPTKLVLLSLATFGVYEIVWMGRQWRAVRERTGDRFSPVFRALFGIFYIHMLFKHIRSDALRAHRRTGLPTGTLAGLFIGAHVLARLLLNGHLGNAWLVGFLAIVPLVQMQREVNRVARRELPNAPRNPEYGAGTVVILALGGVWWVLTAVGMLVSKG